MRYAYMAGGDGQGGDGTAHCGEAVEKGAQMIPKEPWWTCYETMRKQRKGERQEMT